MKPPSRRQHDRYTLALECSWTRTALIRDLSVGGCYVDCRFVPAVGETVEFTADMDGRRVLLRGEVVHAHRGLGFAIRFEGLDHDTQLRVAATIARKVVEEAEPLSEEARGSGWRTIDEDT